MNSSLRHALIYKRYKHTRQDIHNTYLDYSIPLQMCSTRRKGKNG
ncbi:hypothetical protein MYOV056v2_p0225 [Vibrio phage 184E37.3a]|nr:hypothetical protein MYOV056v2_p0225 [Vibrio phage 184E37.3a]QZI90079.1 hypothetical protein MYOV057v1_p0164 [Vibrio phage 184E37.1]